MHNPEGAVDTTFIPPPDCCWGESFVLTRSHMPWNFYWVLVSPLNCANKSAFTYCRSCFNVGVQALLMLTPHAWSPCLSSPSPRALSVPSARPQALRLVLPAQPLPQARRAHKHLGDTNLVSHGASSHNSGGSAAQNLTGNIWPRKVNAS